MDIYNQLKRNALSNAANLSDESCCVRGAWTLRLAFRPELTERLFEYDVAIVQTEQQGAAYAVKGGINHNELRSLVGKDIRECLPEKFSVAGIAALDALCGSFQREPTKSYSIDGISRDKANKRAKIVVDEVLRISQFNGQHKPRVANIGAIGNIIKELVDKGCAVFPTDLEQNLVGVNLHGCKVLDGAIHTDRVVADCDIAIITGMTLATGVLDRLVAIAEQNHTYIVLVAETGAWLGHGLLQFKSIQSVISEPFPFYIFSGRSSINIFSKENVYEQIEW